MGWTQIMQSQLAELATREGYCKTDVLRCLHDIKMDPILISVLQKLYSSQNPSFKLVIASDSNTIFIDEILKANGIEEGTFDLVYTNAAIWTATDTIQVEPYQSVSSPHQCPRSCPANMCKTSILQRARKVLDLEYGKKYQTVYVGDGGNDYCPSLSLSASDLVLVRDGFALHKLIENTASHESERQSSETEADGPLVEKVVARTKIWKTQSELGEMLQELISQPRLETEKSVKEENPVEVIRQGIETGLSL